MNNAHHHAVNRQEQRAFILSERDDAPLNFISPVQKFLEEELIVIPLQGKRPGTTVLTGHGDCPPLRVVATAEAV